MIMLQFSPFLYLCFCTYSCLSFLKQFPGYQCLFFCFVSCIFPQTILDIVFVYSFEFQFSVWQSLFMSVNSYTFVPGLFCALLLCYFHFPLVRMPFTLPLQCSFLTTHFMYYIIIKSQLNNNPALTLFYVQYKSGFLLSCCSLTA